MNGIREELNQISNDRFHNKEISYAINVRYDINVHYDKSLFSIFQVVFDEIEVIGNTVLLFKDDICSVSFNKETFNLRFGHYDKYVSSMGKESGTIHYNLFL